MLKQNKQRGFTIVELLIVIVVIGILAALVLNTFSGVQKRARDTQRQTDVNALATQLEVYYNDKGYYPIGSNVTTGVLKGLDGGALTPPNSDVTSIFTATSSTAPGDTKPVDSNSKEVYVYMPLTGASTLCTTDRQCDNFKLFYWKEDTSKIQTKVSLNQP